MNDNPYQVPAAELERPEEFSQSYHDPRGVGAGRGTSWIGEGWRLFNKAPVIFVVMSILAFVLFGVVSLVPFLGTILAVLFWPHLNAGFYYAFSRAQQGQAPAIGDLFEPFKNPGKLVAVGALYLAATVVLVIVMGALMANSLGSAGMFAIMSGGEIDPNSLDAQALGMGFILALLVTLALTIPMMMAFLFAPILVHQHNVPAMDAVKLSFSGCLRNILPFLVWSLVWFGILIAITVISVVPILGWLLLVVFILVAMPLFMSNMYVAYRDIYVK